MSIDINRLSSRELDTLISQAKKRKTTLDKRKPIAVVRSKVVAMAKAEGYGIDELFAGAKAVPPARKAAAARKSSPQAGRKIAPKYRNPANPQETWAGRGQQPRWLRVLTGNGRKLEDFLIQ